MVKKLFLSRRQHLENWVQLLHGWETARKNQFQGQAEKSGKKKGRQPWQSISVCCQENYIGAKKPLIKQWIHLHNKLSLDLFKGLQLLTDTHTILSPLDFGCFILFVKDKPYIKAQRELSKNSMKVVLKSYCQLSLEESGKNFILQIYKQNVPQNFAIQNAHKWEVIRGMEK